MGRRRLRITPATVIASIALFVALGGTVYAAKKIDGRSIKVKSLPGNRVKLKSLPGNRVKPGSLPGNRVKPGSLPGNRMKTGSLPGDRLQVGSLPGDRLERGAIPGDRLAPASITGAQIDAATLGQVPSANHAERADSARDAETALNAINAVEATKVNGHTAGCDGTTRRFAGACWQTTSSEAAVTAPVAASACAAQGGELPEALALAAFSQQPGIALALGDEWSSDIATAAGPDVYAVMTVAPSGQLDSEGSTFTRNYRCVLPLVR